MSADPQHHSPAKPHPHRLIVCFDGTGNVFKGTPGDTNIVKLYNMFDRNNNDQMHYYQPGIGTYPAEGPVNVNWFRTLMRKFDAVMDSALATSFDSHVIAGYKFIMRHYKPGTKIYVFGFSRGAFTARFLSRMISHVGLLSIGNDELVPFAYQVYQEYEQNRGLKEDTHVDFMNTFKKHFCRTERDRAHQNHENISKNESGIKVHFLGLFDCVSSVGNLDIPFFQKTPPLPAIRGTAKHIRHAVAIDERRVKFKAALFSQEEKNDASNNTTQSIDVKNKGECHEGRTSTKEVVNKVENKNEDIKEVWFPGNHGDVGGGWDLKDKKAEAGCTNRTHDDFQLSDIALKWMMDEIDNVDAKRDDHDRCAWDPKEKGSFLRRFQGHKGQMIKARMHDTMARGVDSSWPKVMLWNLMEYLPWVIKRWEYVKTAEGHDWQYIGWPPNRGERRDIPPKALFHNSVIKRMSLTLDRAFQLRKEHYVPTNQLIVVGNSALTNGSRTGTTMKRKAVEQKIETTLAELAEQYTPKEPDDNSNGHGSEWEPLVSQEGRIHFHPRDDLTVGSVAVKGQKGVVTGAQDWDRIYCVVEGAEGTH